MRLAFPLSAILCFGYAFFASIKVWPPLDGDAPAYFSPAVEFSQGRGLVNQVWLPPLDDSIDGPGGRRYTYHGLIYPLLIGWLGRLSGGGATACVAWMHIFNALVALVASWGVLGFCRWGGLWRGLLAFVCPIAWFALCEGVVGRPEPAVVLWLGMGLIAVQKAPGFCPFLLPFFAGLTFFSSPAMGVLAFVLLGAFRLTQNTEFGFQELALGLTGALAAAGICFLFYPYPAADWFMGVWRHSRINLGLPQGQGFFPTWIACAQTPVLLLTFAVPFVLALWSLVRIVPNLSPIRRIMFCTLGFVFLLGIAKVAFFKTEASYNAVVWIPVAVAMGVGFSQVWLARMILLVSLCLPVLGLARNAFILGHQFTQEAVSFREVWEVITKKIEEGVEVSSGLFLAVPDPRLVSFAGSQLTNGVPSLWRIEQQTYRGAQNPPDLPNYEIVENRFGRRVMVLGVPISRTPGGWEYAIYKKKEVSH